MASPVNTADIILENALRARYIRAAKTFPDTTPPYTNVVPSPDSPATSGMLSSTSTSVTNPFGTYAKLYAATTATSSHFLGTYTITTSLISTQKYQVELYVRDDGSKHFCQVRLKANNASATVNKFLRYDFDIYNGTSTVGQSDAEWSSTFFNVTSVGNGWWKLVLGGIYTPGADETTISANMFCANTANVQSYAGDGVTGFYAYAPQAYLNQFADEVIGDSYIDVNTTTYRWNGMAWYIGAGSAKVISLISSTNSFTYDGLGALNPSGQYIRFSINRQNTTATCTWTTSPSVSLYTGATTGSVTTTGDTVYLRAADFGTNTTVSITATVNEATAISDTTTIIRLQNGTNNTIGYLTNEAAVVAAASDGTGYSLTGTGGSFKIFNGITDVSSTATFGVGTAGTASATQNGLTLNINTATGVYSLSGGSWTSSQELFNLVGVYGGTTVTKVYSIAKSLAGVTGPTGPAAATAIISRDTCSVPCDSTGTPTSYSATNVDIYVYEGNTYYTYESGTGTPTATGAFRIATSASGITAPTFTASGSGTSRAVGTTCSGMTTNPATITYTINIRKLDGTTTQTLTKLQTLSKSITGSTGITGTRGTIQTSISTTATTWSDSSAATAITNAGGVSPIQGDVVTEYNSGSAWSETRIRSSGGTWTVLTAFFGGDVIVDGTLNASKITAASITTDRLVVGAVTAQYNTSTTFSYTSTTGVSSASLSGTTLISITSSGVPLTVGGYLNISARLSPVSGSVSKINNTYTIKCINGGTTTTVASLAENRVPNDAGGTALYPSVTTFYVPVSCLIGSPSAGSLKITVDVASQAVDIAGVGVSCNSIILDCGSSIFLQENKV